MNPADESKEILDWDVVSKEFRSWIRDLLANSDYDGVAAIAMVSADTRRVICGAQPFHYNDQPCLRCSRNVDCKVPSWCTPGTPSGSPSAAVVWSLADGPLPQFALHSLDGKQSLAPRTRARLTALASLINITWDKWSTLEKGMIRRAVFMAANDAISRLATSRCSLDTIEAEFTGTLRRHFGVSQWMAVLFDAPGPVRIVPEVADAPTDVLEKLLQELLSSESLRGGDWFPVVPGTPLDGHLRALGWGNPGVEHEQGSLTFVVPVVVNTSGEEGAVSQVWAVFAGFPKGPHPRGDTITQVRSLSQSALMAWDSAYRADEAEQKFEIVRQRVSTLPGFEELVGETQVMQDLRLEILRVAKSDGTVLLVGEPGTGKEVIARLIHSLSDRARFPFVGRRLTQELNEVSRVSRSFYPATHTISQILQREYREIPGTHGIFVVEPKSKKAVSKRDEHAESPKLPEIDPSAQRHLTDADPQAANDLKRGWHPWFLKLATALRRACQADKYFNFFEFDSGAAATENIASELFGVAHERFTGVAGGPGRFQTASRCGGTLFLDNIHHLPRAVQSALLKATEITHEERSVTRVGASLPERINVRLVAASIRDLSELVDEKTFLAELASRLMVEVIRVPPLRDRREDIPRLAEHFAGLRGKQIAEDATELLVTPDWRNLNVRGLRSVVENSAGRAPDSVIRREHVEKTLSALFPVAPVRATKGEERMIRDALRNCGGNVSHAAKQIGWSRQKLYRQMKKYGISD